MPTLAALPDAIPGATLREVATQAPAPRSLRHLRIRVDDLARRALALLVHDNPGESAASILQRLGLPTTSRSIAVMREFGFAYEPTDLDSQVRWRIHAALVDAFGRQVGGASGSNTAVPNDMQFQSNWMTFTIGTRRHCLSPSRVYDPELGRFLQRDPLPSVLNVLRSGPSGNRLGVYQSTMFESVIAARNRKNGSNLYKGMPVPNAVDPSGMDWLQDLADWFEETFSQKDPQNVDNFVKHYFQGGGAAVDVTADYRNTTDAQRSVADFKTLLKEEAAKQAKLLDCDSKRKGTFVFNKSDVTNVTLQMFAVGHSTFFRKATCQIELTDCYCCDGKQLPGGWAVSCQIHFSIRDRFVDPLDIGYEIRGGVNYPINADWDDMFNFSQKLPRLC